MTRLPPEFARVKLEGHPLRRGDEEQDPIIPGFLLLVGSIVAGLIALCVIPVGKWPNLFPATAWVFTACYGLLAARCAWVTYHPRNEQSPGTKPADTSAKSAWKWGVYGALFMLPWNYLGIGAARDPAWGWLAMFVNPFMYILWLCDFIVLSCFGNGLYRYLRSRKFGVPQWEVANSPVKLGRPLKVTVTMARPLGYCRTLNFTARCVEEVMETVSARSRKALPTRRLVVYQLWGQTIQYEEESFDALGQRFVLEFELPDVGSVSGIVTESPHYWEIEATAHVEGINFNSTHALDVMEEKVLKDKAGAQVA